MLHAWGLCAPGRSLLQALGNQASVRGILTLWILLLSLAPCWAQPQRTRLTIYSHPPDALIYDQNGHRLGHAGRMLMLPSTDQPELTLTLRTRYYEDLVFSVPQGTSGRYPASGLLEMKPIAWWVPAYTWARLNPAASGAIAILVPAAILGLLGFWWGSRSRHLKLQARLKQLESLPRGEDELLGSTLDRWRLLEKQDTNAYVVVADDQLDGPRFMLRIPKTDPASLARFQREVQLGSQLTHPNVVKVEDYGTANGTPYLVTELVPGQNLRELMPLSVERARELFPQILTAVAFVHTQQAIHRNLIPESIRVRPDGRVVLMDFALAARTQRNEISGASAPVGRPEYQAPEQKKRHFITQRTDQYTLGLTLNEVLTPDAPAAVREVLKKMQAEEPRDRYNSVQEALDALKAVL